MLLQKTKKHFFPPQFCNFNGPLIFGTLNPYWVYVIAQGFPPANDTQFFCLGVLLLEVCHCLP